MKWGEELNTNPTKMSLRLLRQTCPWTVAGLGSARTLGKRTLERTVEHLEYLPSTSEVQQLLSQMKKENISRIFLNSFVSYNVDNGTTEEG